MMSESRIARARMGVGGTIGVTAAGLAALDIQLNIPDWMIRVAMIKLAFIAAGGLLAAGALVGRHARSRSLQVDPAAAQLGEGPARDFTPDRDKVDESFVEKRR
jgi:hypothetical protein